MKLSRVIVPAAVAVISVGGLAAPSQAATAHCADYKSPDKVELSGDQKSVFVGYDVTSVCIKAGTGAFEDQPVVGGYITSPNGKGISYYVPTGEEPPPPA